MRYELSPDAKNDVLEIRDYLWEQSTRAVAARILNELRNAFCRISEFPGIGHWRNDLVTQEIRFYRVRRYLILYRETGSLIQIIRVLHGARDIKGILGG